MLRGMPHLTKYMPRCRDARRTMASAGTEPNFYIISNIYPLPDQRPSQISMINAPLPQVAPQVAPFNLGGAGVPRLNTSGFGQNALFSTATLGSLQLSNGLLHRQQLAIQQALPLPPFTSLPVKNAPQAQSGTGTPHDPISELRLKSQGPMD